jgi:ribokinase
MSIEKPIVVVGSINLDLVAGAARIPQEGETITAQRFNTFFGGKGGNQAVAAAKLGYPVSIVGNVGSDSFGVELRQGLMDAGVDVSYVNTVEGSSGLALITTGARGENSIVVVPGANRKLTPELLETAAPLLERAGFLLAQLEIPLETVDYLSQFAERRNIPYMLDPAPARELSRALLGRVTWLTPNETETAELLKTSPVERHDTFRAADQLLAAGVENVLLKLGSKGCAIAGRSCPRVHIKAFPVQAVDTTAAGDAFNAGFAVGMLRGGTVSRSALFASAVAAIAVTRPGAQASMASRDEVERFLAQQSLPEVTKV